MIREAERFRKEMDVDLKTLNYYKNIVPIFLFTSLNLFFKHMKNCTNKSIFLLSVMFAFLFICSCGEHRKNPQPIIDAGLPFHLVFRATVSGADLLYNSIYHAVTSRAFIITDFRYYVSNVTAIRDDGTEQKLSGSIILVDPHQRDYNIGKLPEGSYTGIRFTVGLDSAANHCDPTVFEKGNPLAIQTPSMHWDWNSGYLFMKIEGKVDTTKRSAGAPVTEFFYHLGMDRMKRVVEIPTHFAVSNSLENNVRLKFDLAKMLAGVDMQSELSTHSFDNQPLAVRMADSWQQAFLPDSH
jgi:hypothetical protein